jgi:tRNA (mo5U34)-methyltransferase
MEARNAAVTAAAQRQIAQLQRLGWYHSIELPDGSIIQGHQDLGRLRWRLSQFPVPADLRGKRVLDIGAWDGWFSFEMERRGAQVVAVDQTASKRFLLARELMGSKVEYVVEDIFHLSPRSLGRFDIVLFLGVLYHLKHPLLALERVCEFTTDLACVESYISDPVERQLTPLLEFYETTELRGQFDNWVGPNTACLLAMCRTAGFARVQLGEIRESRCHVTCYRTWPEAEGPDVAPVLMEVENTATRTPRFAGDRDEYLSVWFKHDDPAMSCDDVAVQVGPYGSRAVLLQKTGAAGWHLDCKLPPGLDAGTYPVRLKSRNTRWSNQFSIRVGTLDAPQGVANVHSPDLLILGVADGFSWESDRVTVREQTWMSIWVLGIPPEAQRHEVSVRLNDVELEADFVSTVHEDGWRQVNVRLPDDIQSGYSRTSVRCAGQESDGYRFLIETNPGKVT